jgi:hypothetical protein
MEKFKRWLCQLFCCSNPSNKSNLFFHNIRWTVFLLTSFLLFSRQKTDQWYQNRGDSVASFSTKQSHFCQASNLSAEVGNVSCVRSRSSLRLLLPQIKVLLKRECPSRRLVLYS